MDFDIVHMERPTTESNTVRKRKERKIKRKGGRYKDKKEEKS